MTHGLKLDGYEILLILPKENIAIVKDKNGKVSLKELSHKVQDEA